MAGTLLLSRKLQNLVRKRIASPENYVFTIRNIIINGAKRGCSGFIRNTSNNTCVYVNTERSVYSGVKNYMCRFADNEKDYSGYQNRWADTPEELVTGIINLLHSSPAAEHDCRI